MNILVCSQQGEIQVTDVLTKLKKEGLNFVLFERYRKDHFITYKYQGKPKAVLRIGDKEYPLDSLTFPVVWYRPKPVLLSELPGEAGIIEEKFCAQEWRGILKSLDVFLEKSFWINPIWNSQRASCKSYQLKLASELGLRIPETLITNDARQVAKLFNNKRVVYKTLNSFFTAKEAIFTNEISLSDVISHQTEISMAPGIFQQYVEKDHELRVTVIGEKMFIARINSQEEQASQIDWRRCPNPRLYQIGQLTENSREKLLNLHKRLGLVYAAYDFIVDQEGHEVFLECNPSGQWLWLENFLGLEIGEMLVAEFKQQLDVNLFSN